MLHIIGGGFIGGCLSYVYWKLISHDVKKSNLKNVLLFQCILAGILLGCIGVPIFQKCLKDVKTINNIPFDNSIIV